MYSAITYENETLTWLSKHAVELLLAIILGLLVRNSGFIQDMSGRLMVVENEVHHINKAVNNVSDGEVTLRELVVQSQKDIGKIKSFYGIAE